jgi:hypothetical protein
MLMARKIVIKASSIGEVSAEVLENKNPKTADAIWNALPIEAKANRWGDEIYFSTGVKASLEDAQEVVGVGEIAYWPPGKAFCIFFGPTPASTDNQPRAASEVNVFAKTLGDPATFKKVRDGEKITIERQQV